MNVWQNFHGAAIQQPLSVLVETEIQRLHAEGYTLRICIGTDSIARNNYVQFATALVFVAIGNGGFMFVKKQHKPHGLPLKERMLTEIAYSIEAAYKIEKVLRKYNVPLEIHADINKNPKFQSHKSYSEAMGYITSMGYQFVSKPDAFASSSCADRFCH